MPDSDDIQRRQKEWVERVIEAALSVERNWYGTISIEVKAGRIDKVLSTQSLKPPK